MSENASGEARDDSSDTDNNPSVCRECGIDLGAGYLCDDCDTVEGWPDVSGV